MRQRKYTVVRGRGWTEAARAVSEKRRGAWSALPAVGLSLLVLVFRRHLLRLRAGPSVAGNTEGLGVRGTSARGRELHGECASSGRGDRIPAQARARAC